MQLIHLCSLYSATQALLYADPFDVEAQKKIEAAIRQVSWIVISGKYCGRFSVILWMGNIRKLHQRWLLFVSECYFELVTKWLVDAISVLWLFIHGPWSESYIALSPFFFRQLVNALFCMFVNPFSEIFSSVWPSMLDYLVGFWSCMHCKG